MIIEKSAHIPSLPIKASELGILGGQVGKVRILPPIA